MGQDADVDLLRRRVLNVVGHELRTPATTLAGLAHELESCDDDTCRGEIIPALVRHADRLDHLVDDLLLAASISTVVPVGDRQPIDLVGTAREIWSGELTAGISAEFAGEAVAVARPDSVRRILDELLTNAAVHGEPPVVITGRQVEGTAELEVASGGPVVSEADLALATEAFYRGERAVTTAAGLGLGLAVARTLARADGGDVAVHAGDGGGVVARLELPST